MSDICDRAVAEPQQVAGVDQPQAIEVVQRRAAGLLFHLTVQRAQRHREPFGKYRPVDFFVLMFVHPVEQIIEIAALPAITNVTTPFSQQ